MYNSQYLPTYPSPSSRMGDLDRFAITIQIGNEILPILKQVQNGLSCFIQSLCEYLEGKGCRFSSWTKEVYPYHGSFRFSAELLYPYFDMIDASVTYWYKVEEIVVKDGFIIFILN